MVGGGMLETAKAARLIVLPLASSLPARDAEHIRLIEDVGAALARAVVSQEWVMECLEAGSVVGLDPYRVRVREEFPGGWERDREEQGGSDLDDSRAKRSRIE